MGRSAWWGHQRMRASAAVSGGPGARYRLADVAPGGAQYELIHRATYERRLARYASGGGWLDDA